LFTLGTVIAEFDPQEGVIPGRIEDANPE